MWNSVTRLKRTRCWGEKKNWWGEVHNEEFHTLYYSSNAICVTKSSRMRCSTHGRDGKIYTKLWSELRNSRILLKLMLWKSVASIWTGIIWVRISLVASSYEHDKTVSCWFLAFSFSSILKMEATYSPETYVDFQRATWRISQKIELFIKTVLRPLNPTCHNYLHYTAFGVNNRLMTLVLIKTLMLILGGEEWTELQGGSDGNRPTYSAQHQLRTYWSLAYLCSVQLDWSKVIVLAQVVVTGPCCYHAFIGSAFLNSLQLLRFESYTIPEVAFRIIITS